MATPAQADRLAQAHITAQERLRALLVAAVARQWANLPSYDEKDVPVFLAAAVPLALGAQRQAAALTEAFLARAIRRPPVGVAVDDLVGAAVRAGAPPDEVYRRPFVTIWTALKDGAAYEDAVNAGLARAKGTAATDVQLTMRKTLAEVGQATPTILGYRRVPDGNACAFCRLVSGQRYRTDQLMPIHAHCGCGVDVITAENRHEFTGNPSNDLSVTRDGLTAEVREHGELGPVLVDGDHHFTQL